ncbi:uncharacterized protein [Clytia hemisphaerica]|uniref:Uncharacterized protein n=1 Tax=Clytia hemisphaerica TaxID=252671 RepID=A0A7M5UYA3_9CNID
MRIRRVFKKPNGIPKLKGGSRSYKAVILDLLQECKRILEKNNMMIPEWFDGSSFETGFFTNEGRFVEKEICFMDPSDKIIKSKIIEDKADAVEVQEDHYEDSLTGLEEPAIDTRENVNLLMESEQGLEQTHVYEEASKIKELEDAGYESDSGSGETYSAFGLSNLLAKTSSQNIETFEPWFMPKDDKDVYEPLNESKSKFGPIGPPVKSKNNENQNALPMPMPMATIRTQRNFFEEFSNDVYSHWESRIWKNQSGSSQYL